MLNHDRILLFDFETTGLNPQFEQIIEIGAIVLEKQSDNTYHLTEELSTLVMCDKPLPQKITDITHITDEMLLREGITQEEAFHLFFKLYQDEKTLLVAYNIQFDLSFLIHYFRRYWNPQFQIKNDILDVMAIYKDRHRYPHRLDQAVATYQVEVPNTHRALDDILATYQALLKMMAEKNNIGKYINVIGYNPTYGVSGLRLPHVRYIAQRGGQREIENS
ncbi:MAG: 3'-5' exonuclease [Tenericutes bacterium HGW-Tenericutes-6]|jgi:DNA polymerase III epsilon subunit family exonuclease|nr:MAG: 3'-5' exonuclease [Tenericutes bacterium HGW-Tenericutes-6]